MLVFIDNVFRFVQAGSEVSTLLGRMPSAVGYQPTLADEMGVLQERITSTRGKSITSMRPETTQLSMVRYLKLNLHWLLTGKNEVIPMSSRCLHH